MRDTGHLSYWMTHVNPDFRRTSLFHGRHEDPTDRERRAAAEGQIALYARDLRVRLRCVCGGWDEHEFEALVQQIARMKVRWSELDRAD